MFGVLDFRVWIALPAAVDETQNEDSRRTSSCVHVGIKEAGDGPQRRYLRKRKTACRGTVRSRGAGAWRPISVSKGAVITFGRSRRS
jgi:hypothetical protein